jgi:hypothetical protein
MIDYLSRNSISLLSSVAKLLHSLALRLHALGPGPLYESLAKIAQAAPSIGRMKHYATLDPEVIRCVGGDRLRDMR